jgi:hypothetical protein
MSEMAYDALVCEQLEAGAGLKQALKTAAAAYPDEELLPATEQQWEDVLTHYQTMVEREIRL